MEIVVKAALNRGKEAEETVARHVREALGEAAAGEIAVSRLFPGATAGRRAGMLVVRLPDRLSKGAVDTILGRLRVDDAIEYAEWPAAKRPMSPD